MSEVKGNVYQSDVKGAEGAEGFVALLFAHLGRMSFAINNTDKAGKDAIVYYNAYFIINHVPKKELRTKYKKQLTEEIEKYEKSGKSHDAAVITASLDVVGDIIDHVDEIIGLEKVSKIAVEFDCGSCEYMLRCKELDAKEKEEKIIVG